VSSSSQNAAPVSITRALADLAAVIDPSVTSDQAAELIEAFRTAVHAEAFREARDASDIRQLIEGGDGLKAPIPSLAEQVERHSRALRFFPTGGAR
jgi:tripartite-type tricarboxylate transporter receptor subunit TctC